MNLGLDELLTESTPRRNRHVFSWCCVFAFRKLKIKSCLLFQSEFSMQEESEKAKLTCQDCDGESRGVLFVALW